ncbi:MAG: hypothetical protein K9L62_10260 [Vallitaleaceae bacterium]|nr:hypothetical protein [Vallitaleaceae bacterium]
MYESRENTKWFSQTLLTHKDKFYGTDGYLRVAINTNTEDYKYFNPPALNISIQNNYQKSYHLSYHNASDLLNALRLMKKQSNGNQSEIQRKYQKNMILYIKFFVESNNNDSVVDIRLLSNETDFTKVIIPIEIFGTFAKCISYYTDNYFNICNQLLMKTIDYESNEIIHQLPSLIKRLSARVESQDSIQDDRASEPEVNEATKKVEATINDLDNFLGADMNNITIPELGESGEKTVIERETPVVEVDSPFIKYVLKNDLSNLENMLNNHSMNPDPINTIMNELHTTMDPQIKGEFSLMPGINNEDLKSLLYMSKMIYATSHINYVMNNISLPASVPVLKYKAKPVTPENIELAYDILLIGLYLKNVRGRLENKSSDAIRNKALFHLQIRCFMDNLVFSFLGKEDTDNLESIILNRYKYFDSIGVFDKYKTALIEMRCPEIKEHDIASSVNEVIQKVIGKTLDANTLHSKANGNFRIPSKNTFSLEQITNEIIPLEVAEKSGKDIKNDEVIAEIKKNTPISDEIYNFFVKGKTKVKITKDITFNNNLERVINFYSDDIPDKYKDGFIKLMKHYNDKKFDLTKCEYPLDEFGDNIIRALYLWDPNADPKITTSYKHFQLKIENELMEKDLILTKIKDSTETSSQQDEWDFLSE